MKGTQEARSESRNLESDSGLMFPFGWRAIFTFLLLVSSADSFTTVGKLIQFFFYVQHAAEIAEDKQKAGNSQNCRDENLFVSIILAF
jgi:hypothetical protein